MTISWELRDEDREFFYRELDDFVPARVYDIHAHLWRRSDWDRDMPPEVEAAPAEVGLEEYREGMDWIMPGREVHGLHFAFPAGYANETAGPNAWVGQEIKKDALARGQFYVRPTDDPDWVRDEVKRLGLRGFKPFACFAARPDKNSAEIPEYMPEWIARLADEQGWSITLHMQRARSLADASNLHWINTYCRKYRNMTLILDHGARGFNPYHLIEGLGGLEKHPNLYVDTSVVCNALAVWACVEFLGIEQVVYGSDFYCSCMRGTNVPIANSFVWLDEATGFSVPIPYDDRRVFVGLENLRAIKTVFRMLKLSDKQVEGFFWSNAAGILGL